MSQEQLFIFTAGDPSARAHLDDSIKNPIDLDKVINTFSESDQTLVKEISATHGLYAWGAIPGPQNNSRWKQMKKDDWVLCVYDNKYRYMARILATFDNESFANTVWGRGPNGETWELAYLLEKPVAINRSVAQLGEWLNKGYMGFTQISDEKVERINREYGSLEKFVKQQLMNTEGIPDGITREDVLNAIHDYDSETVKHDFGKSSTYDLLHDEKRYPPKAIIGIAARRFSGRILSPHEFAGGDDTKCFQILRNLGFTIVEKKSDMAYFIIRSNQESSYNDQLGKVYHYTSNVPNNKKILNGAHVVVDRKTNDGAKIIGYGELGPATITNAGSDSGIVEYDSPFISWEIFEKPKSISEEMAEKIRKSPNYNIQHSIRKTTKDIYLELTEQGESNELCLIGTWKDVSSNYEKIKNSINQHGGWASWWSFIIKNEALDKIKLPFYLYINTGGGNFPIKLKVGEYKCTKNADGMESPWSDITDEEFKGIKRLGEKSSQVFKTWFRIIDIEHIEPPVKLNDFVPAEPISNTSNMLNQNSFGYAYKEPLSTESPVTFTPEDVLNELFITESELGRILAGLNRKKNIILEGPPGVGKTFAARLISYAHIGEKDNNKMEMIQFHQSYSYEDFMQGWRPTESGGFTLKNGVFYEFCKKAESDIGHPYVFIIDEINRGNLSKILGEAMMLIEPDKRGCQYGIPLTYSQEAKDKFSVPKNVYVIGLMNTADRSLAMVDYALRRRFSFFNLTPKYSSNKFKNYLHDLHVSDNMINKICEKLNQLNTEIETNQHLGRGFSVGHSYFCSEMGEISEDEWYEQIIQTDIAPLVEEYWFDQLDTANSIIEDLLK